MNRSQKAAARDAGAGAPARVRLREERGQSLAEFALVLPVLALLIMGMIKAGIVYNHYITLNDAVRVAVRQLAVGRGTTDACAPAITRLRTAAADLPHYNDPTVLVIDAPTVTSSCSNLVVGSDATIVAHYPCHIDIAPFLHISLTCTARTTERVE